MFWCDCRPISILSGSRIKLTAYLQVAKLGELLPTIIKSTRKWLDLLVHNLVSPNIASLSKSLAADVAVVWPFTSVSSFVGLYILLGKSFAFVAPGTYLEIAKLREALSTRRFLAELNNIRLRSDEIV